MAAEDDLASVRSSLLIVAQTGDARELSVPRRNLTRLRNEARAHEMPAIELICAECDEAIGQFSTAGKVSPGAAYAVLDIVARIEAAIWEIPLDAGDFFSDIAGFVDASFDDLMVDRLEQVEDQEPEFEIDEETLEIFRSEADDLLSNIAENLGILSESPANQNALWEVRRNAHTFKGAAGIVGLKTASEVAHRMEDLLDKMVELRCEAAPPVIGFLVASSKRLTAITSAKDFGDNGDLEPKYSDAMAWLAASVSNSSETAATDSGPGVTLPVRTDSVKSTTTPIVRVSLDRLDELIKLSRSLIVNRSAIQERFAELDLVHSSSADLSRLDPLFDAQNTLTDEIQAKLLKIRMVKFGTLEARLSRNVHVTCVDEGKKALLEIENGAVEIDTQMIDALIEPMLHLLKNAVVHGIESAETRRMIGKPERGRIVVRVEADEESLLLSVSDDGGGMAVSKIKEKAVANGLIDLEQADAMADADAFQLIFDRGLTTADKIDLNAGRGVGMSIVKEAVEGRGGSILVKSEPQRGTTFTILMPLAPTRVADEEMPEPVIEKRKPDSNPLVLIVDDSASIRRQATKLVEQAGLRVITATNGAEALELLLNGDWEPDVILSDVEMPQIDGWGLLEYVKTDDNLGHIPVVMVTSLDADQHRERAAKLGASDYFIKPLKEIDVTRVIDTLLNAAA